MFFGPKIRQLHSPGGYAMWGPKCSWHTQNPVGRCFLNPLENPRIRSVGVFLEIRKWRRIGRSEFLNIKKTQESDPVRFPENRFLVDEVSQ